MLVKFLKFICVAVAAFSPWLVTGHPGGPPIRRTGAPGDRTCLDASCHVGTRLDDSPSVRLSAPDRFTYKPGGPKQRWVLRTDDRMARAFGFQMSARTALNESGGVAGRLHDVGPNMQVVCDNQVPAGTGGCVPPTLVQFVQHTDPREQGEFTVEWTPPATDLGDVMVFVAVNASVSGQRESRIHQRSFRIRPVITDGVVDAAGLRGEISSGSWAVVFGQDLAERARNWRDEELAGGVLPQVLDGVRVRVNGQAAAVSFVSPTQVRFQVPDGLGPAGETVVEVWNGTRLAGTFRGVHAEVAPGIFVNPDNGRDYASVTGPAGRRPSAGDVIAMYATGMGATEPSVAAGRLFAGAAPLVRPVSVRIGGLDAPVRFAGLTGAGLYQINVLVPALQAGEHLIEVAVDGKRSQPLVYLALD